MRALGVGFVLDKIEFALGEAAGKERDAFTDEHGNDAEVEFVDQCSSFRKSRINSPPPMSQICLPGCSRIAGDHRAGRFVCEDDVVAFAGRLCFGKDVIFHGAAERAAHFQAVVVSLAAKDTRVDGFEEGAHRIVLGHEEKIDGAVRAGDVAVEADAEAEDDFACFARRAVCGVLFVDFFAVFFAIAAGCPSIGPRSPLQGKQEWLRYLAVPQKRLFQS